MLGYTEIEVTDLDIDQGKEVDCQYCPIALAIKRAIKFYNVMVAYGQIYLSQKGKLVYVFSIDNHMRKFIIKFDSGDTVSPIKFALDFDSRTAKVIE